MGIWEISLSSLRNTKKILNHISVRLETTSLEGSVLHAPTLSSSKDLRSSLANQNQTLLETCHHSRCLDKDIKKKQKFSIVFDPDLSFSHSIYLNDYQNLPLFSSFLILIISHICL